MSAPHDPLTAEESARLGLADDIADAAALERTATRLADAGVTLPTFAELADPARIPAAAADRLAGVDRDSPDAANLFRVHWHNSLDGSVVAVPDHIVLPPALTGVEAPIVVLLGDRFPMIGAHKVLAAYACLAPRLVTGRFDPTAARAVWPSTGNYARGGVAISRIMGCRGVAVLPAGMSAERFEWLDRWVADPADVIRTPGSESNVKEIYDECARLAADPANVVLNQFCEFANHLAHWSATATAASRVHEHLAAGRPGLRVAAWVSASGSAGTLGAGDRLKEEHGARVVVAEALECPTLLRNGYGEHNIQGIGDKHVPLIHNVMNTDVLVAVSDRATDDLDAVVASGAGRRLLSQRGVPVEVIGALEHFGLSTWCNVLAAARTARLLDLGPDDALYTVATDGSRLYDSERQRTLRARFEGEVTDAGAAAAVGRHIDGAGTADTVELTTADRSRIFNLGYFTWVEQQGIDLETFERRRHQSFWRSLRGRLDTWDGLITEMNERTGTRAGW